MGLVSGPRYIPNELVDAFTMHFKIKTEDQYCDNDAVDERYYPEIDVLKGLVWAIQGKPQTYPKTTMWLHEALNKYRIQNSHTVVMGSVNPQYETMAVAYRASPVTIVEYAKIICCPIMRYITCDEYLSYDLKFDNMISISTFEHDGLGRYGDPIDPDADLKAMKIAKEKINKGGLMFLAVPCAKQDLLCWNAHRVYGPLRLPLLLEGWQVIEQFGSVDDMDEKDKYIQPVFVLRNV
jgi:hypothetical protein